MPLKVIGTGLGRTGTMSLKHAMEQLGFGPCHHMIEVFQHPATMPLWVAVGEGRPDWEAIFANYSATVDYPACKYWRAREFKRVSNNGDLRELWSLVWSTCQRKTTSRQIMIAR